MKSRKSLLAICCIVLSLCLLLAGCGGGSSSAAPSDTASPSGSEATDPAPAGNTGDPVYMRMGTGGTGGVFYTFGVGVGTLMSTKTNMQFTVESTKASVENMRLLESGDIETGFASFPTSLKSIKGAAPFEHPIDVNVLLQVYRNPVHVIVMADSPYHTMEDLKGTKISIGQPGSGNAEVSYAFLEGLMGWVDGTDYAGQYLTYTESVEAFKSGQIDCAIFDTVNPTATIIDLASWKPIRLIPVDTSLIQSSSDEFAREFVEVVIPGGTYKGQDEDVVTIGHGNFIMCRSDWDEEYAYLFVKTIFENLDYMKNVHAAANDLTPELAKETGGVPLHPGAERYFKEVGAL